MTPDHVDTILRLPAHEIGPAIADAVEDQWFDRKSVRIKERDLADHLVAFANAEGGTIVVGVSNGEIEGTDARQDHRNALMQASLDFTVPAVPAQSRLVPCVRGESEPDHLLVFDVKPSETVHANVRDEVYLRVGDETRRLSFAQRQELMFDKGQGSYDARPIPAATFDVIDEELLTEYANTCKASDVESLLQARGFASGEVLTVAGLLLFATYPQQFLPEAYTRVLRYRGTTRGSGADQQLLHDQRIEGPIGRQLPDAFKVVKDFQPTRRALGAEGRFEPTALIPEGAWFEAIANAVIHRSYSLAGDHIRVEIFDDRMEITSPGRFPGIVSLFEPWDAPRFARNPRIARACADLSFGQELGEGIRRIYEEMHAAGLVEPVYRQTAASVRLTLSASQHEHQPTNFGEFERIVLAGLRQGSSLTTAEVVELTGVSKPTALRKLRALADSGVVRRAGKSPNDPSAHWTLVGGV